MKETLIHFINVGPQTSFNKINFNLLLEKTINDNFFSNSINYFSDLKNQCPNLCEKHFHLFVPFEHEEARPFETLPHYKSQSKKYLSAIFYINNNNNNNNNNISFNSFVKNYKDFIKRINGELFFSNIEIFIRENRAPFSEVLELPYNDCGLNLSSQMDKAKLEK